MNLGVFIHANKISSKEFKEQTSFVEEKIGQAQITLDYPFGFENFKTLLANKPEIVFRVHAPFMYLNCLALDEDFRGLSIKKISEAANLARKIGAEQLIVHLGKVVDVDLKKRQYLNQMKKTFSDFEKITGEQGIEILIENLNGSGFLPSYPKVKEFEEVLNVNSAVNFCLDIGHAYCEGVGLVETLKKYGPKIKSMHVHDSNKEKDHLKIGDGEIDFKKLKSALDEINYSGAMDIELLSFQNSVDSFNSLRKKGY